MARRRSGASKSTTIISIGAVGLGLQLEAALELQRGAEQHRQRRRLAEHAGDRDPDSRGAAEMVSIEAPRRTTRPRTSSGSTAKGRTTSSSPSNGAALMRPAAPQAPGQDALLRVQPVLGLVEDHGLRSVHDLVRDLLAAMGGQAMHEDRVLVGHAHQRAVDLIGLQQVVAAALVLVAHGDPAIGDDGVGALGGLERRRS